MALRSFNGALLLASKYALPAASSALPLVDLLKLGSNNQQETKPNGPGPALLHNPHFRYQWARFKHVQRLSLHTEAAAELLQQTNVLQLRQDIEDQAATKVYITYQELVEMCRASEAAATLDEAEQLVNALMQAGVVLKFHDIIYLRPNEIAEIIFQALPGTKEEAEKKLGGVEAELEVLHRKHQTIEREARWWPNMFLYTGCVLLAVQLVAFMRLTFYELSWDVMEPVAYFTSLFYTLVGYIYFLVFRNGFDYPIFEQYWHSRNRERRMKELNFDPRRYGYLLRLRDRYRTHLAALDTLETLPGTPRVGR